MRDLLKAKRAAEVNLNKIRRALEGPKQPLKAKKDLPKEKMEDDTNKEIETSEEPGERPDDDPMNTQKTSKSGDGVTKEDTEDSDKVVEVKKAAPVVTQEDLVSHYIWSSLCNFLSFVQISKNLFLTPNLSF